MKTFVRPALLSLIALAATVPAAHAQAPNGNVPTSGPMDFLLGLKRQQGALERVARAVAEPSSAHYRSYLGTREISRRFGANPVVRRSIDGFFRHRGARARIDPSGAFASVRLDPAQVRTVFGVGARAAASGAAEPRVPDGLEGIVTEVVVPETAPAPKPAIQPTPGFRLRRTGTPRGCAAGRNAKGAPELPTGGFTPNQIADAYGLGELHRRGLRGQGRRIALLEFGGGFNASDMSTFAKCFGLPVPKLRVLPVDGPVPMPSSLDNSGEVSLDIQVLTGMAPELESIDVYEGSKGASFAQAFAAVLAPRKGHPLPDAISMSFGSCEAAVVNLAGRSQRRLDRYMTMVAAAAGVPIVVSADDQGSSACESTELPQLDKFPLIDYPAGQHFVTAVGGTSFMLRRDNSILSQRVWNDRVVGALDRRPGAGGGGTSQLIGRPWYQLEAGIRRGKGRHVPDLAFYADALPGWAVYCTAPIEDCRYGQGWISVGGTSAATPLFAASIALVNQHLARHGQPRLGFPNPLLYQLARSKRSPFRDVVRGNNDLFDVGCCPARPGYDRASGWGSLHVARFAGAAREAYGGR